jgi:anti-sigma factor RsiW
MSTLPEDAQVKALLKQHAERFDAPAGLRNSIMLQTQPPQAMNKVASKTTSSGNMWSWLAIPRFASSFGMGALAATLVVGQYTAGVQDKQAMLLALASDHARAVVTQNTIEVKSSSMHTVKPWLSSQLGYSPLIVDLADHGFPLIGGRRGFIGGTPVAVAVYGYKQHEIDVYVLTSALYQQFPSRLGDTNGFHTTTWKADDLHYIAISDMNAKQLVDFGDLLAQNQANE